MTRERGWNQVVSQAVIGQEPAGPPRPHAAFEAAAQAVPKLLFSNPGIVRPHFDALHPLLGRRGLLELKALGLHILAPVVVADVVSFQEETSSSFGMCLETLAGHIERGREVVLRHQRPPLGRNPCCRIEASWRLGDFPSFWMQVGFFLVGRRYQRAWHHLAHWRLREQLGGHPRGTWSSRAPVQFWAGRALARSIIQVEEEHEDMTDQIGVSLVTTCRVGSIGAAQTVSSTEVRGHTSGGCRASPNVSSSTRETSSTSMSRTTPASRSRVSSARISPGERWLVETEDQGPGPGLALSLPNRIAPRTPRT